MQAYIIVKKKISGYIFIYVYITKLLLSTIKKRIIDV